MKGPGIIKECIELDIVDSTNRYALDYGKPGLLVTSSTQTSGKGRHGRAWFSPHGTNLYLTLTMGISEERYPIIAGVAVRDALAHILDTDDIKIKWPNDIIIYNKKICGILCETKGQLTAIGIGINVNQTSWPEDLEMKAISMSQISMKEFDINQVKNDVLISLDTWLSLFFHEGFGPFRNYFLKHGVIQGYEVYTEEGEKCTIVDLDMDGRLIINVSGKIRKLVSGTLYLS